MNDDREVSCYALLLRHHAGDDVRAAARSAWFAQRDGDDGCTLLVADALRGSPVRRRPTSGSRPARRPRVAGCTAGASGASSARRGGVDAAAAELFEQPQRYLARRADVGTRQGVELTLMALARLAAE